MTNELKSKYGLRLRAASAASESHFHWFCEATLKILDQIYKQPLGMQIIKLNGTHTEIEYLENACEATEKGGARIFFDPKSLGHANRWKGDPTYSIVKNSGMQFIYLYHELVHTYHFRSGTADKSEGGSGLMMSSPYHLEEFKATGLYEYADDKFAENQLRRALHLPRRPYYYIWPYGAREDKAFEAEMKRRLWLGLPRPPAYDQPELWFNVPHKIFKGPFTSYINSAKYRAARHKFYDRQWNRRKDPKGIRYLWRRNSTNPYAPLVPWQ